MVFVPLKDCPCPLCSQNIPTVRAAADFNDDQDAKALRAAMRGFGCNNEEITAILPHRSANQRVQIEEAYKASFGRDLIDDLKDELGGNFERLVIAMMHPWPQFAARAIKKACKGAGTNEQALVDVLCTANNCQIKMIAEAFQEMYGQSLEEQLESELSGDFKHLLVAVAQGTRKEEDAVDVAKAKEDATAIHEAGELKYGTDESTFTRVLVKNSYQQLDVVSKEYHTLAGKTLEEVCTAELSGDILNAAKAILGVAKNKDEYWAQRLHASMAGLGTDDKALINILVARSEIDLGNIKREFLKIYEKTLDVWIEDECSGDYKKMLLALIAEA